MDDETETMPKEPLVAKIVDRFREDVFAAATFDLLMTEMDVEDYFIDMIEKGKARISKKETTAVEMLKHVMFVDVRESKKDGCRPSLRRWRTKCVHRSLRGSGLG